MKDKILRLRKEGKTYSEIQKELKCSKGTISYHCGKGQKEKSKNRQIKNRKLLKNKLKRKIDGFCRNKIRNFKRFGRPNTHLTNSDIKYEEAFNKLLNNPVCYLTGEVIDLEDTSSYELDHIVPVSKGGENTLENMGLTIKLANRAKTDMSVQEFIELCKKVLVNYKIKD